MKAYMVADAHLDTQWNWDIQTTIKHYVRNTLTQNIYLLDNYPNYVFNFEGAVKYSWMKEYYPLQYEQMKKYVADGRWHLAGSGWDAKGIAHKYEVLRQAMEKYTGDHSPADIMRWFGGYEMVAAVGGMLRAAECHIPIIVDGFIMTACVLAASRLYPEMLEYCIFGHQGDESGHKLLLDYLHARPLLCLGLRLGEGTGAICSYPIIDSAIRMINEMNSFRDAEVTKYF